MTKILEIDFYKFFLREKGSNFFNNPSQNSIHCLFFDFELVLNELGFHELDEDFGCENGGEPYMLLQFFL